MPRQESTNSDDELQGRIRYVKKEGSPLFGGLAFLTFAFLATSLVLIWLELTEIYGYDWTIFGAPSN